MVRCYTRRRHAASRPAAGQGLDRRAGTGERCLMTKTTESVEDVWKDFHEAVNMTASQIEKWLETDESKEVGQKSSDDAESVGHHSGRKIVAILGTKKADLTDADAEWMRKVVGYVKRHSAQRPEGDIENSRWRYSLMNWGNDPLK
jgi:hypothetical protein